MKLAIMSDLHTEFEPYPHKLPEADVLILAGDITVRSRVDWINKISDNYKHGVIYVFGNHEFYKGSLSLVRAETKKLLGPKVHLFDNDSIRLGDRWFHGGTLWTSLNQGDEEAELSAKMWMNDLRIIRNFKVDDWKQEHKETMDYLEDRVQEGDVVITHHSPSFLSCHPRYAGQTLNHAYHTNLEDFMKRKKPSLWIHGHTHESWDYKVEHTRVICNPKGYPLAYGSHGHNFHFEPNKVVEI